MFGNRVMRRTVVLWTALALLALPALADPSLPRDVPAGHWAANAVRRVTAQKLMTPDPAGKFNGNEPVTRYELAVTLDRLVRDIEAAHKPLSAAPDTPVHFPKTMPVATAQALSHLVGGGFLPPRSSLVVKNGTQPVTAQELADALSQVTLRLSDRSLPPPKD